MFTPNCEHTGTWQPFTQQQIIQHAHNCEYIMWISDVAFLTPWNIYNPKMSLNSYYVKFMQGLTMTNKDPIINK